MTGEAVPNDPQAYRGVASLRPTVRGGCLYIGGDKLYLRGVTYGTFRPGHDRTEFPAPDVVAADFAAMAAAGLNAVRTYVVPPQWVLDAAAAAGLRVMVGLPWEQHVTFLDNQHRMRAIEARVRAGVRACVGHPAVLCYVIGSEIPAPIVGWHGPRPVERFLRRLYLAATEEDPHGLVTYVNSPDTEHLELPFLDLLVVTPRLESSQSLASYLAHQQHLAGNRPLVLAETGLDSRRHGLVRQAYELRRQVEAGVAASCAGVFVFAWTDEWHRNGRDVDQCNFGLTTRSRVPKPALSAVREAFTQLPPRPAADWPRISVVVCTHNGAAALSECLHSVRKLDYPEYEVIVVDDGSTDHTGEIIAQFPYRVVTTRCQGLAAARNAGLRAATGEIIAYTDDNARPDPDWLTQLALAFRTTSHAAIGGLDFPLPGDGAVADCAAAAPGNPLHPLRTGPDDGHLPGCNMAFRREKLSAIGGFDSRFRTAGDDVDINWRLKDRNWTVGFNPGAVVWHHPPATLRGYWRQQCGYGRAEALLMEKWPHRYRARPTPAGLPAEWHLLSAGLAVTALLGLTWSPLLLTLPVLALTVGVALGQATWRTSRAESPTASRSRRHATGRWLLTAALYLTQPVAQLWGRSTGWRRTGAVRPTLPRKQTREQQGKQWRPAPEWFQLTEAGLREAGAAVLPGDDLGRWQWQIRGGPLGGARVRMVVEEHGDGRQLIRKLAQPYCSASVLALISALTVVTAVAAIDGAAVATVVIGAATVLSSLRLASECGYAVTLALTEVTPDAGQSSARDRTSETVQTG